MSLLEDRLLRIIELRQTGKSHAAVARALHIPKRSIVHYERSVKASLQEAVQKGVSTLGEAAAELKMTRTVTGMAMEYFGLKIPVKEALPEVKPDTLPPFTSPAGESSEDAKRDQKWKNLAAIRSYYQQGERSAVKIAEALDLDIATVYHYAGSLDISLTSSSREQRISILKKAVRTGKNLDEICQNAGIQPRTLKSRLARLSEQGILIELSPSLAQELDEKVPTTRNPRLAEIARLAGIGKTRREIAQELSLSYSYLSHLSQREGIKIPHAYLGRSPISTPNRPRLRQKPSDQAVQIKTALEQGERSLEKLLQHAQTGILRFHLICRDYKITLPEDIIPYRYRPEFDTGIAQGHSMEEIAAANGKSRQLVNIYIKLSGQQYFWEQQKAVRKQQVRLESNNEKDIQRNTLYRMEEKIRAMAKEQGWAYEKMVEYDFSRQKNVENIPLEKLLLFFQRYETAKSERKKISLQQLSQGLFYVGVAGRLLKSVGLEPLHGNWNIPSREVTRQKKEFIARAIDTPLSAADLEYFTGLHAPSIEQYITKEGGREQKLSTNGIQHFGHRKTREILTYRLASEIYEAHDTGFSAEETMMLLDGQQQVVEYALEHQKEISATLIKSLQVLYPGKKITKPYLLRAELPTFRDLKQEAMQRAFEQLPWNAAIVSYFLDLSHQKVQVYHKEQGGKPRQRNIKGFNKGQLTIPTASKVYRLQDQDMDEKQIQHRLHQPQQVINYALLHRFEIEPNIIKGLQVLFPEEKISKPYR